MSNDKRGREAMAPLDEIQCGDFFILRAPVHLPAAPVVSFAHATNTATTEGGFVTVSGLSLRTSNMTPTATVGLASCATSVWASTTSAACAAGLSIARTGLAVAVTVDSAIGTQTSAFSLDGLVLCRSAQKM